MTTVHEDTAKGNGKTLSRRAQEAKIGTSQTMERLAFRIQSGEVWSGWIKITPGMAQEILAKYNTKNRPYRASRAKKYARQMAAGQWHRVSVPILFAKGGWMLDGQHRLSGCVEAATSVDFFCVFGEPDENFAFIDLNGGRNAADIFSIYGVPNAVHAAAITRFVSAHTAGKMSGHRGIPFFGFDNPDVQHQAYLELGADRVQRSCRIARSFGDSRMPFPTVMGGVHFLCARKSMKMGDDAFHQIRTGETPKSSFFKLRDRLLREKLERLGVAGDTIQAWNAARTNRRIGQWYSSVGGKFPVIL